MYNGRFQAKQPQQPQRPVRRRKRRSKKTGTLLFSLVLLFTMMIGGTLAYLTAQTRQVTNQFTPAHVTCAVDETFDNIATKSMIRVQNTGNIDAYIRVKLVSYRVSSEDPNRRIGGTAAAPDLSNQLGAGWVKLGEYYYFTTPVQSNGYTGNLLSSPITLTTYNDADGGKQVIEVMAEAIQSEPAKAVGEAWGVRISQGGVTAYSAG